MITTQGFQVQNMPNPTVADPALVALNPLNVTTGALASINVGKSLDELKDFRQRMEEHAKMEGARTKLLQAQADKEAILRDKMQAEQESEVGAAVAGNLAKTKVAPVAANEQVAQSEAGTAIAEASKRQSQFQQTQEPTVQAAASLTNAGALDKALYESLSAKVQAEANWKKAQLDLHRQNEDFLAGKTGAEKLEEAKTNESNAKASLDQATAGYEAQRGSLAAQREQTRLAVASMHAQNHTAVKDNLQQQSQLLSRLTSERAVNPENPSDKAFTAGQLFDSYFTVGPDGKAIPREDGFFFKNPRAITPQTKAQMDDIAEQRLTVRRASRNMDTVSQQIMGQYQNPSQPPPTQGAVKGQIYKDASGNRAVWDGEKFIPVQ